jgi:phage/plasmid-like protein (TIGR03299 family)
MSHGIVKGIDFGYTTERAAWHAFETGMPVLDTAPATWAVAKFEAKLDWKVNVVRSFYLKRAEKVTAADVVIGSTCIDSIWYEIVEDLTGKKTVRDDTESVLGSGVSNGFVPVQNDTLGELAVILADQGATFWTAGSLYEGRKVFITMKLSDPYVIGSDERNVTVPFITLTNAHDGSGSLNIQPCTFEVLCANTAKAAELFGERTGRQFTWKHTANVMDHVEEAKAALAGFRQELDLVRQTEQELFEMKISREDVELFLDGWKPTQPVEELGATNRVRNNATKARSTWMDCWLDEAKIPGEQRLTALGLFRASTDWVDHAQGTRGKYGRAYRSLLAVNPMKTSAATQARLVGAR